MRNKRIIGTFHYNKSGLGYVVSKTDEETFVVPLVVSARDGVFDGDTVEIICPPEGAYLERGGYGKLIRVVSHARNFVEGTLFHDADGKQYLRPNSYIPFRVLVKSELASVYSDGDFVLAEIIHPSKAISALRVRPVKSYGKSETYESALAFFLDGSPFGNGFSEDAVEQVKSIIRDGAPVSSSDRAMYNTDIFCPVRMPHCYGDTAFHVWYDDNGCNLDVHILDVDACVPEGSPLEVQASQRFRGILNSYASKYALMPLTLHSSAFNLVTPGVHPTLTLHIKLNLAGYIYSIEPEESMVSGVVPVPYSVLDNVNAMIADVSVETDKNIRRLIGITKRMALTRREAGGVPVRKEKLYYCDAVPSVSAAAGPTENCFSELMLNVGAAFARICSKNNIPCLYSSRPVPVFTPEFDTPLYLRALTPYCDIYAANRFNAAYGAVERSTQKDLLTRYINFCLPPMEYYDKPVKDTIYALNAYAPLENPTNNFDAVLQQRFIRAHIRNEKAPVIDTAELTERSIRADELDRRLRLLAACKLYKKHSVANVTLLNDGVPLVAKTQEGVLADIVMGNSVLERYSAGSTMRARIKTVSFLKTELSFYL